MTDSVRWGILGSGKIAPAFAGALRDVPIAVPAGVYMLTMELDGQILGDWH